MKPKPQYSLCKWKISNSQFCTLIGFFILKRFFVWNFINKSLPRDGLLLQWQQLLKIFSWFDYFSWLWLKCLRPLWPIVKEYFYIASTFYFKWLKKLFETHRSDIFGRFLISDFCKPLTCRNQFLSIPVSLWTTIKCNVSFYDF